MRAGGYRGSRRKIEVDAVELNRVGALLHLGVDCAYVFSHYSKEDQLDRRDEENSD